MDYTIGIDEVGRGPIAGPLVVCACAIRNGINTLSLYPREKLRDSKKLSEKQRKEILEKAKALQTSEDIYFGLGEISAEEVDRLGLSIAIKEALSQALANLHRQGVSETSFIFLDGSLKVDEKYLQETVIKGDEKIPEISLASIYAKEYRDQKMKKYSEEFPEYKFDLHVGYGTSAHYAAIKIHGLTPLHRRSFLKGSV